MKDEEKKKPEEQEQEWRPSVNPWIIAAAVVLAAFVEVLDTTIVSVALEHMAGSLAATTDEATWVLTSYLVANAIILPASGWFARRFGRKRFLMICMGIFIFSSFLCGIAPSMGFLVFARIMQGLGGGALQPIAQAVLLESFPKEKRGVAMAAFGLAVVFAPVLGPTLGGWLTENYSWRWVFNINIPIGLLGLFLMGRYLEDPPYIKNAKPGRIDTIGFGLLAVWLATLQIVLDKGQTADWFATNWIVWFSVISAVSLGTLIWWELRTESPIVDFRVFANRNFWVGTLVLSVVSAGMYGTLTILPLYLQNLMGYTAEGAGFVTGSRGIGAMCAMILAGAVLSKVDGRRVTSIGIIGFMLSTLWLGRLTLQVAPLNMQAPQVFQGVSIGLIFVSVMALAMSTLPNEKIGNASGIFNLMRNLGGSVGISMATTYISRFSQSYQAQMAGNLSPENPVYQQYVAGITRSLSPMTGAPQAGQVAHGMIYGIVQQQAAYQAFMAVFGWCALGTGALCVLPFLMKKVGGRKPVAMH